MLKRLYHTSVRPNHDIPFGQHGISLQPDFHFPHSLFRLRKTSLPFRNQTVFESFYAQDGNKQSVGAVSRHRISNRIRHIPRSYHFFSDIRNAPATTRRSLYGHLLSDGLRRYDKFRSFRIHVFGHIFSFHLTGWRIDKFNYLI